MCSLTGKLEIVRDNSLPLAQSMSSQNSAHCPRNDKAENNFLQSEPETVEVYVKRICNTYYF